MNCAECEQLFDAYLDGHLAGSLRLEFDAHRLRCRHCQQTLAMLEAIGNVIAADPDLPELHSDFSTRVMRAIEPARTARPRLRIALATGVMVQAAAVLAFVLLSNRTTPTAAPVAPAPVVDAAHLADNYTQSDAAWRKLIMERVEVVNAAGKNLSSDFTHLTQYLNFNLPDDVARESVHAANTPMDWLLHALVPSAEKAQEAPPADGDVHSL